MKNSFFFGLSTIYFAFLFIAAVYADGRTKDAHNSLRRYVGDGKIVNGDPVKNGDYNFMVYLIISDGESKFLCGGSMITETTVLTAAHCTYSAVEVEVAFFDRTEINTYATINNVAEIITTSEIYNHGEYNEYTFENDVAILKLPRPPSSTNFYQLIEYQIPSGFILAEGGKTAKIAGWGTIYSNGPTSDELLSAEVIISTDEECAAAYSVDFHPEEMICSSNTNPNRDSCQGDSGGPMFVEDTAGTFYQIGITSWGYGCADPDYPGVYARVENYVGWIEDAIAGRLPPPPTPPPTITPSVLPAGWYLGEPGAACKQVCHGAGRACNANGMDSIQSPVAVESLAQLFGLQCKSTNPADYDDVPSINLDHSSDSLYACDYRHSPGASCDAGYAGFARFCCCSDDPSSDDCALNLPNMVNHNFCYLHQGWEDKSGYKGGFYYGFTQKGKECSAKSYGWRKEERSILERKDSFQNVEASVLVNYQKNVHRSAAISIRVSNEISNDLNMVSNTGYTCLLRTTISGDSNDKSKGVGKIVMFNGERKISQSYLMPIRNNRWYKLTAKANGNRITCTLENTHSGRKVLARKKDSKFPGKGGFRIALEGQNNFINEFQAVEIV